MADLKKEYTDLKDVTHYVEHLTLPAPDNSNRERIIEELLHALTKPDRKVPA